MSSKTPIYSLSEAHSRLQDLFEDLEAEEEFKTQENSLECVEEFQRECMVEKCGKLHTTAEKHFRIVEAPISKWQRNFTASDFEKSYLQNINMDSVIQIQKAKICVDRCLMADTIFNRTSKLNQDLASGLLNNCLQKVGVPEYRTYNPIDPKNTPE